jgi:hypothetical protein
MELKGETPFPLPAEPEPEAAAAPPQIEQVDHVKEEAKEDQPVCVCPFCWKKLGDKLSGMAHVKSCGKDLPTERIFDALQLHEKQVREWEELGITHPGFQNPSTSGARGGKAPRAAAGTGRTRKKKADPELELALALSVSLHEEIEQRKRKSQEYLIKIGLEKEVEEHPNNNPAPVPQLLPPNNNKPPSSFRVRFGNKAKTKLPKNPSSTSTSSESSTGARTSRARRGKLNLAETKLFTVTEEERRTLIGDRVAQILEESEKENEESKEKYKESAPEVPVAVSRRLNLFRDEVFLDLDPVLSC